MIFRHLLGVLVGLALAGPVFASCDEGRIDLKGGWGAARFNVEVADDPKERSQGLMFRESLAASAGMLFVYEGPQRAVFWMKNTLIPLDMIFMDSEGVVSRIHENAVPHDETGIDGGDGVQFVLEINGGFARRLGIDVGSVARHPAFGESAEWACGAG